MNRVIWTAGLLLALTSCESLSPPSQVLTLRTDSVRINCVDGAQGATLGRDCFKVYTLPENAVYDVFSVSTIKNFVYEEGYEWTLLVRVTAIKNPPADAVPFDHELIRVIDKKKVP